MRFFSSRLHRKIILIVFATLFVVIAPIIIFELSNAQREIYELNERNWDLFTESVFRTVETIMLEGRSDIANSLLSRFKEVKDVEGLDVARMDGTKAYTKEHIKLIDQETIERLKKEGRLNIYKKESGGKRSLLHLGLLLNKEECSRCHGSDSPYRGIVIIKTSLGSVEKRILSSWKRIIIAVIVALIVLIVVIPIALKRMVTRPLDSVLTVTEEISKGDLTRELTSPSEDEIGSLVRAINLMKDGLRLIVKKVKDSLLVVTISTGKVVGGMRDITDGTERQAMASSSISSSVIDINKLIDEIFRSISKLRESMGSSALALQEMKASIKEISDNTSSFARFIEETSTTIEESFASIRMINEGIGHSKEAINSTLTATMELRESVRDVKDSVKESSCLAREVVTSIREKGVVSIKEARKGIELIRSSAMEMTVFIDEMKRSSERIDEIIGIIDEVADSTKLLSLNASILSAQAGEYGKGFSVVADEIGRLATHTAEHTKEIATIISAVKNAIDRVFQGQHKMMRFIDTGYELLGRVDSIFEDIQRVSNKSAERAFFIERATEEQSRAIQEISSAMEAIVHRIEEIAKASEYQRLASSQILRGIERMKDMAEGLKKSTEEQYKGSEIISTEAETIFEEVDRIRNAMDEVRERGLEIIRSIEGISDVAKRNFELSTDLKEETERFREVVGSLEKDINRFRV